MGMQAETATALVSLAGQAVNVVGRTQQASGAARRKQRENEHLADLAEQEARQRADSARDQARDQRDKLRERQRKEQARKRAAWGSAGVVLGSGSPLAVMEGRAAEDAKERLELLDQGERAASRALLAGRNRAGQYRGRARGVAGPDMAGFGVPFAGSLLQTGAGLFEDW
ncbi:MAG: hypothetical protein AB7D47_07890 [Desulfovibrio sp.]